MIVVLIMVLLLIGCDSFSTKSINDEVLIKWVRFDSTIEVNEVCRLAYKKLLGDWVSIQGCANYNLKKETCTIYSLNPRSLDDERTCTLGHEVKHCFDGDYHGN